jgi:N-acetylmuramoyl-L-alanine amidase
MSNTTEIVTHMYGFIITHGHGGSDFGIIEATSEETARLRMEATMPDRSEDNWTIDIVNLSDLLYDQYGGVAYLTTESGY